MIPDTDDCVTVISKKLNDCIIMKSSLYSKVGSLQPGVS